MKSVYEPVAAPRLNQEDWDGASYGNPRGKVLAAATLWEYARELGAVCDFKMPINQISNKAKDPGNFLYPMNLPALLAYHDFPREAFITTAAFSKPFPMHGNSGGGPIDRKIKLPKWIKPAMKVPPGVSRQNYIGFSVRVTSPACPNSFALDPNQFEPFPGHKLDWLVIAHKNPLNHNISSEEIDDYVKRVDSDIRKFRETAFFTDNESIVISAAYIDDSRSIYLGDSEVNLHGDYSVWTLPWDSAKRSAAQGTLWRDFERAHYWATSPLRLWKKEELQKALRALFAFRLARVDPGSVPTDLQLKGKLMNLQFPLSPVKSCGRDILDLAKDAMVYANRLFPEIKNLKLLTAEAPVIVKNTKDKLFE